MTVLQLCLLLNEKNENESNTIKFEIYEIMKSQEEINITIFEKLNKLKDDNEKLKENNKKLKENVNKFNDNNEKLKKYVNKLLLKIYENNYKEKEKLGNGIFGELIKAKNLINKKY